MSHENLRRGRRPARRATLALLLALCALPAAQAADPAVPDTRSMIDALRPPGGSRNLMVRVKPAASAAESGSSGATGTSSASAASGGAASPTVPGTPAAPPSLSLAIPFESNSARLRPESGNVLGNLVAAMQSPELTGSRFVIEGHTDAHGAAAANQRLSQERADEVRLYLVTLGVHPARLKTAGKGSSEPVNAADPLAAENRRVRVVLAP